jgi:hypothetical protein
MKEKYQVFIKWILAKLAGVERGVRGVVKGGASLANGFTCVRNVDAVSFCAFLDPYQLAGQALAETVETTNRCLTT